MYVFVTEVKCLDFIDCISFPMLNISKLQLSNICHLAITLQSFPCFLHNNLHLGSSFMIFALPFSENPIILFHFQAEKSHQTPKTLFFALSISWEFPM